MTSKSFKLTKDTQRTYTNYRESAEKRGYEFKLSTNQFYHIINSNCAYCGNEPREYSDGSIRNGIDRVDNEKGYEHTNVIACCSTCNMMKGTLSFAEFRNHCEKIMNKTDEISELRLKYGDQSSEMLSYAFKFGKYLSPNEIFRCIMSGHLTKEDVKYDFKIALQEFDEEFNIVKRQLKKHKVKLRKLTREVYNRSQLRFWHKAINKEEAILAERIQLTELLTL